MRPAPSQPSGPGRTRSGRVHSGSSSDVALAGRVEAHDCRADAPERGRLVGEVHAGLHRDPVMVRTPTGPRRCNTCWAPWRTGTPLQRRGPRQPGSCRAGHHRHDRRRHHERGFALLASVSCPHVPGVLTHGMLGRWLGPSRVSPSGGRTGNQHIQRTSSIASVASFVPFPKAAAKA
jgi:hypothetical protein